MSAFIGALRVTLGIDTAEFMKGIEGAQDYMRRVGRQMQSAGQSLSLGLTAPLAALGALTLKTAGDFEASMSRLGAATGATANEFAAMEAMARELGKSTIFSATEAADAMETLAKNGLTVEQILGGATKASLDLAAATGTDMASAADVATDVMLSFGKGAGDLGEVVDGITGVLLASKFGFDDYRLAIGQAGGVAGGLGVEFEDMNAALVATSNLFASGSDAGTSFKTFLQRLVPQSDGAAAAMNTLGLEFFDVQGNMKSMEEITAELRDGLNGLSEEAKTRNLTTIFGTDAMRTAIGLAGTTAERYNEIQEILASASGAEQAAARMGPFNAAMEQLSGAFEELQLVIAKSGLLAFVTDLVTKLTNLVDYLGEANPAILRWGTVIAAAAAALGPLLIGLGLALTAFAAVSVPVWGVIAAVSALSAAILYFWDDIQPFVTGFASSISEALGPTVTAAISSLTESFRSIRETISGAFSIDLNGSAFSQSMQTLLDFLANRLMTGVQLALNTIATAVRVFSETVRAITALFQGDFQGAFNAVMASGQAFASGFISMVEIVLGDVRGFGSQLLEIFRAIPGQMAQIGRDIMAGLLNGVRESWEGVKSTLSGYGSSIRGFFTNPLGINSPSKVMHEVGMNVMQGLGNGMDSLAGGVQSSAQGIAQTVIEAFSGIIDGTKSVKAAIGDMLKTVANAMLNSGLQRLLGGLGGGKGGGGFLGGLLGGVGKLFGFADGGNFQVGGAGGIDSQLVAFRASPNETVSVTKPGQERTGGGIADVRVFVDQDGNWKAAVERISGGVAAQSIGQYDRQLDRSIGTKMAGARNMNRAGTR